jgi:ATP-binding cassette subfamily B protein
MNRDVYSFLLRTYGRSPGYWAGFFAVVVQTILLRVVSVIVIAQLASNIAKGDLDAAKSNILMYLAVAVTGLIFKLIKDLVAPKAENGVYRGLMVSFYKKLVSKDMSFYRDHQTGYLSSVFRQNVDSSMELVRLVRGDIVQTFISLTFPVAVLFIASWKVGLAALAVIIVQAIYVLWSSSAVNHYRTKSHEAYRNVSGAVADDVTNIVAYKTSGSGASGLKRVLVFIDAEIDAFWQRRKRFAFMDSPRDLVSVAGTALAFWIIIDNSQTSSQSVALVVLAVTYMFQVFQNVGNLPEIVIRHDDLVTKLYPTLEYLTDKYQVIKDPAKPKRLKIGSGRIDIDSVSFAYPDSKGNRAQVFDGLDLHINGGQQVGVVGLSGAGKSTLASLLMRFDDVDSGSIKIDDIDIRDVRQDELRSNVAYVPQEPLLFHRTIRENLQYFGKDMSEENMVRAAKAAHAQEFIDKLPSGYDTLVGERGVKLSGGQKQRVVIARAILKNAPIMLFDEATSALDSESEKIIQKALPQIIGKRTAIVIAHRLSTVAGLDRIIVMEDGKIAEDGTHVELLKLKGRYYSLWQKQTNSQDIST